jgi:hypothetical protein
MTEDEEGPITFISRLPLSSAMDQVTAESSRVLPEKIDPRLAVTDTTTGSVIRSPRA